MQALISVLDDLSNPGPPSDMAAIGAFNDRLRAEGHWVFANGLSDPSAATVIDGRGEVPLFTDGPFLESKDTSPACGLSRLPSRCGAQARRRGVEGLQSEARVATFPRPRQVRAMDVQEALTRAHREEWARVVASLTRRFRDPTLPRRRRPGVRDRCRAVASRGCATQPRRLADDHRLPQGHRPDPAREQARRQTRTGADVVRQRSA